MWTYDTYLTETAYRRQSAQESRRRAWRPIAGLRGKRGTDRYPGEAGTGAVG